MKYVIFSGELYNAGNWQAEAFYYEDRPGLVDEINTEHSGPNSTVTLDFYTDDEREAEKYCHQFLNRKVDCLDAFLELERNSRINARC